MSTENTDSPTDVMRTPDELRSAADPSTPTPPQGSSSQRPTGPTRQHPASKGDTVRSESEIKVMKELFITTGDDSPAINTAVRDTLTWVLGRISTEELMEEYFVTGRGFQCFTCPAAWSE